MRSQSVTKTAALASLVLAGVLVSGRVGAAASDEYRIDLRTDLPDGEFVVYKGDRFNVSFTPSHDSYVMVLALDKKGNVRILFPNRRQQENFVAGGDEVTIADIYADYTGPVYVEAVAAGAQSYELRYGDRFNPLWNDQRWGKYDSGRSYVSEHRGTFTVSFDDAVSGNQPTYAVRYDADEMTRELDQRINGDYDTFEPAVRDFRDEVYEIVGGETWTSGYVDVYVAERRYNPAAYGGTEEGHEEGNEGGSYSSYYDYQPSEFDYESALTGYGTWIDVRGVRVWRPPVFEFGWRPYTSGYWCHTHYGWYWVGYEPFAWLVYHYGYWYYDPFYGWYWIPDYWGYNWTPANCYWYSFGDYVSWYPAPPPAHIALSLNISVQPRWDPARAVVVRKGNFLKPNIQEVVEAPQHVTTFLQSPDFKEGGAPHPEIVEKAVGRAIQDTPVKTIEKPALKAGKRVVIVKPEDLKAPPKVFQDLDQKVRREVVASPPRPVVRPGVPVTPSLTPRPKPEHGTGPEAPPVRPTLPPRLQPSPAPSPAPSRETPPTHTAPPSYGKPPERPSPPPTVKPPEQAPPRPPAQSKPSVPPSSGPPAPHERPSAEKPVPAHERPTPSPTVHEKPAPAPPAHEKPSESVKPAPSPPKETPKPDDKKDEKKAPSKTDDKNDKSLHH